MGHFVLEESFLFILFSVLGLLSFYIRIGKYCLSQRVKGLQACSPRVIIYSNCLPIQRCHFSTNLTIKSCLSSPAKSSVCRGGGGTARVGESPGWCRRRRRRLRWWRRLGGWWTAWLTGWLTSWSEPPRQQPRATHVADGGFSEVND